MKQRKKGFHYFRELPVHQPWPAGAQALRQLDTVRDTHICSVVLLSGGKTRALPAVVSITRDHL